MISANLAKIKVSGRTLKLVVCKQINLLCTVFSYKKHVKSKFLRSGLYTESCRIPNPIFTQILLN